MKENKRRIFCVAATYRDLYSQCLESCNSAIPIHINQAFLLADSRLTMILNRRRIIDKAYKDMQGTRTMEFRQFLFGTTYNEVFCAITDAWCWPFGILNPNEAVKTALRNVKLTYNESDSFLNPEVTTPLGDGCFGIKTNYQTLSWKLASSIRRIILKIHFKAHFVVWKYPCQTPNIRDESNQSIFVPSIVRSRTLPNAQKPSSKLLWFSAVGNGHNIQNSWHVHVPDRYWFILHFSTVWRTPGSHCKLANFVPLALYHSQKQLQSLTIHDNPHIISLLRDISSVLRIILDLLISYEEQFI